MPITHRVVEGECLQSIAFKYGFFPDTVWHAPENSALLGIRAHPSVLVPGDEIVIPDRVAKSVDAPTGQRHRFRRRGVPSMLRVRLAEDGVPRANRPYLLRVDDESSSGVTDGDGVVQSAIDPAARRAEIVLDPGGELEETFHLDLGRILPVSLPEGVRERLVNLGYLLAEAEGERALRAALRRFQDDSGLAISGLVDDATRAALVAAHGY